MHGVPSFYIQNPLMVCYLGKSLQTKYRLRTSYIGLVMVWVSFMCTTSFEMVSLWINEAGKANSKVCIVPNRNRKRAITFEQQIKQCSMNHTFQDDIFSSEKSVSNQTPACFQPSSYRANHLRNTWFTQETF